MGWTEVEPGKEVDLPLARASMASRASDGDDSFDFESSETEMEQYLQQRGGRRPRGGYATDSPTQRRGVVLFKSDEKVAQERMRRDFRKLAQRTYGATGAARQRHPRHFRPATSYARGGNVNLSARAEKQASRRRELELEDVDYRIRLASLEQPWVRSERNDSTKMEFYESDYQ